MWIHFTSKGKDSTLPQKCKICWLAKPYAFQLPGSGAAQNSQLDQCDGPAVTPFLGVLDFGPVFKLITSQHAVHVQVQQRGIVRVRRCSTRAGKSCAFGTGKRWKKVENGWKKNPHDTSSLTRKINESYAHVPVCAQVILILQTVCVCVLEDKWPYRWRGQTFQHLPEAEHAAFPFSIIPSFGPASPPPVQLPSPPSLICHSLMSETASSCFCPF